MTSSNRVDHFIANSQFVADRIKRIYGREATVIHPPVDTKHFASIKRDPQDFYLFLWQRGKLKTAYGNFRTTYAADSQFRPNSGWPETLANCVKDVHFSVIFVIF